MNDNVSRLNPCMNVHDETQLCSNNVVDDSSSTLSLELSGMSKSFNNDISINNEPLDNNLLIHIHHQANSSANFAVRLVRELFTTPELIGRNVAGARGKEQLDPACIEKLWDWSISSTQHLLLRKWKYFIKAERVLIRT